MRRFVYCMTAVALALGLILSACAPKAAPAPGPSASPAPKPAPAPQLSEWDKVLADARKEGTVTVYISSGAQLGEALKTGLSQYGIKVESIVATAGELELKVATEQRAKAYVNDVFLTGWTSNMNMVKGGFSQPPNVALPSLKEKDVWQTQPDKYDPSRNVYVIGWSLNISLIANTDLVARGEVQSWQDLLDPKWKDRMSMTDPRTGSGPGATGIAAWMKITGEDYWKKMAAQRIALHTNWTLVVDQVVHGEKVIGILPAYSRVVPPIRAGAPIRIINLKEGTDYFVNSINLTKNAPHPNAALVLMNWIFTREGQAAIGKATENSSIRNDVTQDWIRIAELRPGSYTLLPQPSNLEPEAGKNGAAFAKSIFGAQ